MSTPRRLPPSHVANLMSNTEEALRLVDAHEALTGTAPGRRTDVEVLNKGAVVLLVACWEAYIEDLAAVSFDALLGAAATPAVFPNSVLTAASKVLREAPDERKVWALAGTGWHGVLKDHRASLFERYIGTLNTPKPGQVDALFEKLVGLSSLSSYWHWPRITAATACDRLEALVSLRGEIAHRVTTAQSVRKAHVTRASQLISRLAAISSNQLRLFVQQRTGNVPWGRVRYGGIG
jgi:RiboL-PSP-HEPN